MFLNNLYCYKPDSMSLRAPFPALAAGQVCEEIACVGEGPASRENIHHKDKDIMLLAEK